jgi:hypothetical protein
MNATIQRAAIELLKQIGAPNGAVNTYVQRDDRGPAIRVLVDPLYWRSIDRVPETFEGYRVVVERREATIAFH